MRYSFHAHNFIYICSAILGKRKIRTPPAKQLYHIPFSAPETRERNLPPPLRISPHSMDSDVNAVFHKASLLNETDCFIWCLTKGNSDLFQLGGKMVLSNLLRDGMWFFNMVSPWGRFQGLH